MSRCIGERNLEYIIYLFAHGVIVKSPLYGTTGAEKFYNALFADTSASRITFLDVFKT